MRAWLLAAAAAIIPVASYADTVIGGVDYLDPTSFHVTSSVATGSSPVFLNNDTAFSIVDISNAAIDQPLTVYFAVLHGSVAPIVSTASYSIATNHSGGIMTTPIAGPFPVSFVGTDPGSGHGTPLGPDLYTFVGCPACNDSLQPFSIGQNAFAPAGLWPVGSLTPDLDVYSVVIQQAFVGMDQVNLTGDFLNDIIFPLAETGAGTNKVTFHDTSFTNSGFGNCFGPSAECGTTPPPPPPPVPEPSTLAVLGVGLVGLGFVVRRKA